MDIQKHTYFETPIYRIRKPEWVKKYNSLSNKYIKEAIKLNKERILKNKKLNKSLTDEGLVHHSTSLINDNTFSELKDFIGYASVQILEDQGYNLQDHTLFFHEMWVQEFAKKGYGNHSAHEHPNTHVSGFYFLKCSEKTSKPIFYDPRYGHKMLKLPLINDVDVFSGVEKLAYNIKPGDLFLFPSYLSHEFSLDYGIDPFRFIHFTLQAIRNDIKV